MSFISNSQNFEDVMLWRALKHVENGFYIDIGANDPIEHSVTKSMYDLGWRGINCEPVHHWFTKLKNGRVRDINLQIAIGANNAELEFFEVVDTGLSTLDRTIAEEHARKYNFELKSYFVPVEKLTTICEQETVGTIHFLKVDVEGAEKAVLEGIDFKVIRPWIVVVEATKPMSQELDYDEWEYLITSEKYHFVYFDGLNRFYIADEHAELDCHFNKPPNVFDEFMLAAQVKAEIKLSETEIKLSETEIKLSETEVKLSETEVKLSESEAEMIEVEAKINDALCNYYAVINSNSWMITKPLRYITQRLRTMLGKNN